MAKTFVDSFREALQRGDTERADLIFERAETPERREQLTKVRGDLSVAGTATKRDEATEAAILARLGDKTDTLTPDSTLDQVGTGDKTTTENITSPEPDAFGKAEEGIAKTQEGKNELVDSVLNAIRNKPSQVSAFDKLFGEESRIGQFFSPALRNVEEQILDVQGLLENLGQDVIERTKDVEITEAQKRRQEAKEREPLTKQLSALTRSQQVLQAGLSTQLALSEKEFEAIKADAQKDIDAAVFELEQKDMSPELISLVKTQLQDDLNKNIALRNEALQIKSEQRAEEAAIKTETRQENTARKATLDTVLANTQDFLTSTGVIPTAAFQKVIEDAERGFAEGKSLAEIQLGVLRAIGSNPRVAEFINDQFSLHKAALRKAQTSGVKTTKREGIKLTTAQRRDIANKFPEEFPKPDDVPEFDADLSPEQREVANKSTQAFR